MDVFKRAVTLD